MEVGETHLDGRSMSKDTEVGRRCVMSIGEHELCFGPAVEGVEYWERM